MTGNDLKMQRNKKYLWSIKGVEWLVMYPTGKFHFFLYICETFPSSYLCVSSWYRVSLLSEFCRQHLYNINQTFSFRLTITASCPMDLQYFPMDSQLCYIEIESCKYPFSLILWCGRCAEFVQIRTIMTSLTVCRLHTKCIHC